MKHISETIALSQALGGVTIVRKGPVDVIVKGDQGKKRIFLRKCRLSFNIQHSIGNFISALILQKLYYTVWFTAKMITCSLSPYLIVSVKNARTCYKVICLRSLMEFISIG